MSSRLSHLALAALRARSERSSLVNFACSALDPFFPISEAVMYLFFM